MSKSASDSDNKSRRSSAMNVLKLLAAAVAIAAVIKELRQPKEARTWHGAVAGFVPYDFRKPTLERIKSAFWDPKGPIIVGRPLGVGWTLNLGAVVAKVRSLSAD
jgi:hypothetical protein